MPWAGAVNNWPTWPSGPLPPCSSPLHLLGLPYPGCPSRAVTGARVPPGARDLRGSMKECWTRLKPSWSERVGP